MPSSLASGRFRKSKARRGIGLIEVVATLFVLGIIVWVVIPKLREVSVSTQSVNLAGDLRTLKQAQALHLARKGSFALIDCQDRGKCEALAGFSPGRGVRVRTYAGQNIRRGYYASVSHQNLPAKEARCVNIGDTAEVAPKGFSHRQQGGDFYPCTIDY